MKVKSMKGFTLAELLIVMAIVVILAAVAVPTFARQMETARETNDLEVIRNAYTDAYTQAMKDIQQWGSVSGAKTVSGSYVSFSQQKAGFQYIHPNVAGVTVSGGENAATVQGHDKVVFAFSIDSGDGGLKLESITTKSG